jgi:hypothetical protein
VEKSSILLTQEFNQLLNQASLPQRDSQKLLCALSHSLICVTARLIKGQDLVGFVRVSGDGIFNATIWDFVVDPQLPDPQAVKMLLLERLKREIRRSISHCSISIFACRQDLALFHQADFSEDEKGVRAMILTNDRFQRI